MVHLTHYRSIINRLSLKTWTSFYVWHYFAMLSEPNACMCVTYELPCNACENTSDLTPLQRIALDVSLDSHVSLIRKRNRVQWYSVQLGSPCVSVWKVALALRTACSHGQEKLARLLPIYLWQCTIFHSRCANCRRGSCVSYIEAYWVRERICRLYVQ